MNRPDNSEGIIKADTPKKPFRSGIALIAATVFVLAVSLCLSGCSSGSGVSQSPASTSASVASAQSKDFPCHFEAGAEPQQVSMTFFDDMPSVPYIRIDDFYQTFLHGKMDVVVSDSNCASLC